MDLRELVDAISRACPTVGTWLLGCATALRSADLHPPDCLAATAIACIHRVISVAPPSNVAAVVLVADPERTIGGGETRVGGANSTKPRLYTKAIGIVHDIPPLTAGRTISTCHDHDMVCEAAFGSFLGQHFTYQDQELRCLGRWAAETVTHGPVQSVPSCGIPE